jgi:DNA repair protein RadD
MLRDYQQEAVEAVMAHVTKSKSPVLIEAPTGAGKSHIIAAIAGRIHDISRGGRVICIAPSAELVKQNRAKYLATGEPASIYSASAGAKCLRHPVIFATPMTLKGAVKRADIGGKVSAIIIDEAHGVTPTIKTIINGLRLLNENCRVIGLSATPYRLGDGYIFAEWPDGKVNVVGVCRAPYFKRLVYRINAIDLIDRGYLTRPSIGTTGASYDTSGLVMDRGRYTADSIDRAFVGHGRLTSAIVADIVGHSANRSGVIIFAATVSHAKEVLASLPAELSRCVTGDTPKSEREDVLKRFLRREVKYLVNVAVLTTGFDAPHVDVVAILRATESVGLLQQMIGRGLRIADGKRDCLVLDYAENIEKHCPDGDIFNPDIVAKREPDLESITVTCPSCGGENEFAAVKNDDGFRVSDDGYFVDLAGQKLIDDVGQPITAHFGRRCNHYIDVSGSVEPVRCSHRWNGKECHECGEDNDIAARYCCKCGSELVDPNEKLRIDFARFKKDPYQRQCDIVLGAIASKHMSMKGNACVRIDWDTHYRRFTTFHTQAARASWARLFNQMTVDDVIEKMNESPPRSISYAKDKQSGFFEIKGWNCEPDKEPE